MQQPFDLGVVDQTSMWLCPVDAAVVLFTDATVRATAHINQ